MSEKDVSGPSREGETVVMKPTIILPPVELRVSKSAREMAGALRAYADELRRVAERLGEHQPGETFEVRLVFHFTCCATSSHHIFACNGGGD